MNFIYQYLIKTFDDFIYFEIICDNEFLFNFRLNETFKKMLMIYLFSLSRRMR